MPIFDGFQAGEKIREYLNSTNLASVVSVSETPLSPNRKIEEELFSSRGSFGPE